MNRITPSRLASAATMFASLAILIGLWQYLPSVRWISKHTFLNTFFISDPSQIISELWRITFGQRHGFLWPYLEHTIYASAIAIGFGVAIGYVLGVLLSEVKFLDEAFGPIIVFLNNVPRILIIPIIIIIFGFGVQSEVLSASIVVIFVIFFNSYEGGRLIDPSLISFVKILGGRRRDIFLRVRIYNSLVWVAAQIPSAVSFSLLATITAEILGTGNGIGYLITIDLAEFETAQLFALILVTAVIGFLIVSVGRYLVRIGLKWRTVN